LKYEPPNVVGKEGTWEKGWEAITRNAARVAEIALKVLCNNLRLINLCGPFRRCASAMHDSVGDILEQIAVLQQFACRLEDIANIVNRAMSSKDVVNQHMDVLGNYLEQLQEILTKPVSTWKNSHKEIFKQP
jgi:hypothetical protein